MIFLWSREWRAARGGVYNHVSAFGDCHVVMMNLQQGLPSAVRVKPPVFVGLEKAQLTVVGRPRGFGHVCKHLSLAVLLRRVSDICACLCQAGISPSCPREVQELSLAFWQSHCSLKLFFFI